MLPFFFCISTLNRAVYYQYTLKYYLFSSSACRSFLRSAPATRTLDKPFVVTGDACNRLPTLLPPGICLGFIAHRLRHSQRSLTLIGFLSLALSCFPRCNVKNPSVMIGWVDEEATARGCGFGGVEGRRSPTSFLRCLGSMARCTMDRT